MDFEESGKLFDLFNEETERRYLGCLIVGAKDEGVDPGDFHVFRHQRAARAIQEADRLADGKPDIVSIADLMSKSGDDAPEGFLLECGNSVPHAGYSPQYAAEIQELATRRRMVEGARALIRGASNPRVELDGLQIAYDAIPAPLSAPVGWPDPLPLPDQLPPVDQFDAEMLPEILRPWIWDIADRTQCPIDYPAIGAVVALASVLGNRVGIRPKRYDDWTVVPNLWGAVVGRPGVLKTPALNAAMGPLRKLEAEAREEFRDREAEHKAALLIANVVKKSGESRIKEAIKNGGDVDSVARGILNESDIESPARRRYIANDSTVEKLGELLKDNPHGFLVFRDELAGFLRGMDKEGHEGARAFYLESWNGDAPFSYDRIGRGTVDIPCAITSILGGIQPGPLTEYVRCAASDSRGADGLLQRFQLVCWPDSTKAWKNVDRWPDTESKREAAEIFEAFDRLEPESVGAEIDGKVPFLRFDEEAQRRFNEWRAVLEKRLRSGEEPEILESHLAKYRSLIPSLALLFQLCDFETGPVGLAALDRAIRWGQYLESHARRLYSAASDPGREGAHLLAKKIKRGDLKNGFTARDVYRRHWSGIATQGAAQAAIDVLVDARILKEISESTDGRPRTSYRINPKFLGNPPGGGVPKVPEGACGTFGTAPLGGSGDFSSPNGGDDGEYSDATGSAATSDEFATQADWQTDEAIF